MALGFGPQPYVPPGPGKIPFRSWTANPLIDLSRIAPRVPSFGGPLMLNAGPPVTPMPQVAGMTAWKPGQLPLTRQLPRMGGVDVSSLYQKPGTMAQPLTRALPQIGPNAGNVSELLAPRALNAAPVATPMAPSAPSYTPASTPGGVVASTADDLAGLYNTKPTYNSIFSGMPSTTPVSARPSLLQTPGGWKGAGIGAGLAMGGGLLANTLIPENWTLEGGTSGRAVGNEAARGAGLGFTMAGPIGALGGAAKGVNSEFFGDQVDKAAAEGDDVKVLLNMLGGARAPKENRSWWNTPITDLFGGGGEDSGPSAEQQATIDNAKAEAANKYTPSNIYSTAFAMGIPARDIEPIVQQFKSQVAYMKASPKQDARVFDPETGQLDQASTDESIQMLKDAGYDVAEDGSFMADDAFINQQAWNQAYQSLPQVQQQSMETAAFARRNAALQAEIAGLLPRITSGMDPQMQQVVSAQLLQQPQYTAQMEQADALKSMTAQVLQQRQYAALQAAGLLPQSKSSSDTSADVLAAALGG